MSIFAEIVLGEKLQEMTRRAETAEAALAAKRADAIQHHAEMIGEFADMVNQRDAAIARAETAEAALAERDKPCLWTVTTRKGRDGTFIEPTCKREANDFIFVTAAQSAMHFCPNCGHRIEVTE